MSSTDPEILSGRTHADVVEPFVVERQTASHWHVVDAAVIRQLATNHADSRSRELRTMMAGNTLAFVHENAEALLSTFRQGTPVTLRIRIEWRLIRNQSRLIHHDGQSPEQGEVGFHVCVTAFSNLLATPPLPMECVTDQLCIAGSLFIEAAAVRIAVNSQNTVVFVNLLQTQWLQRHQLTTQFLEIATVSTHLHSAQCRTDSLRCQSGIIQTDLHLLQVSAFCKLINPRVLVQIAKRINPVEKAIGTTVPEQAVMEHGVDRRRSISAGHLTSIASLNIKHKVSNMLALINRISDDNRHKCLSHNTLRSEDLHGVADHRVLAVTIGGTAARTSRVLETMEREVRRLQFLIRSLE